MLGRQFAALGEAAAGEDVAVRRSHVAFVRTVLSYAVEEGFYSERGAHSGGRGREGSTSMISSLLRLKATTSRWSAAAAVGAEVVVTSNTTGHCRTLSYR